MQIFPNKFQTITPPNKQNRESARKYLRIWGKDYVYLDKAENNIRRWLPIPESSPAQRLIRTWTSDIWRGE